ncbi:hypothetical protein J6590_025065 [Homalodisca vitripennis]|nr:hypothetical protein J6590_025065 [Homalodisca vitripennis]
MPPFSFPSRSLRFLPNLQPLRPKSRGRQSQTGNSSWCYFVTLCGAPLTRSSAPVFVEIPLRPRSPQTRQIGPLHGGHEVRINKGRPPSPPPVPMVTSEIWRTGVWSVCRPHSATGGSKVGSDRLRHS